MNSSLAGIIIGDKFRHFKGNIYHIVNFAYNETSEEILIVYRQVGKKQLHTRTIENFTSVVFEPIFGDDGVLVGLKNGKPRFEFVPDELGETLRRLRRPKNLTLVDILDRLRLDVSAFADVFPKTIVTLSDYERGLKIPPPSVVRAWAAICDAPNKADCLIELAWQAWKARLNAYNAEQVVKGYMLFGNEDITKLTGEKCWRDCFENGDTPEESWDEELSVSMEGGFAYEIIVSLRSNEVSFELIDSNGDEVELLDDEYRFETVVETACEHLKNSMIQCESCGHKAARDEYPESLHEESVVICPKCDVMQFPRTVGEILELGEQ